MECSNISEGRDIHSIGNESKGGRVRSGGGVVTKSTTGGGCRQKVNIIIILSDITRVLYLARDMEET